MQAEGGTGFYNWFSHDTSIALIKGTGIVKSEEVGSTTIKVMDSQNQKNFDTIQLVVEPVSHLLWVQEHMEVKAGEQALISLMATDKDGRKFTNCTSAMVDFETKGDTSLYLEASFVSEYSSVVDYVVTEKEGLLHTRHLFDSQPKARVASELVDEKLSPSDSAVVFHNNFGICSQRQI